jgi:hypothetical protein
VAFHARNNPRSASARPSSTLAAALIPGGGGVVALVLALVLLDTLDAVLCARWLVASGWLPRRLLMASAAAVEGEVTGCCPGYTPLPVETLPMLDAAESGVKGTGPKLLVRDGGDTGEGMTRLSRVDCRRAEIGTDGVAVVEVAAEEEEEDEEDADMDEDRVWTEVDTDRLDPGPVEGTAAEGDEVVLLGAGLRLIARALSSWLIIREGEMPPIELALPLPFELSAPRPMKLSDGCVVMLGELGRGWLKVGLVGGGVPRLTLSPSVSPATLCRLL